MEKMEGALRQGIVQALSSWGQGKKRESKRKKGGRTKARSCYTL